MWFKDMPPELLYEAPRAMLKALLHPYRRQLLRALEQVRMLSPAEVANSGLLPCGLTTAAYHLTVLADAGLVRQEPPDPSDRTFRFCSAEAEPAGPLAEYLRQTLEEDEEHIAEQRRQEEEG